MKRPSRPEEHRPRPGHARRLLLCVVLAASGCAAEPSDPDVCAGLAFEADSVVLVMGDTIRRDRLASHGGGARTPNLDRLAASGARFDRVSAPAPWTKPSIATLFTGLPPWQHGALRHPQKHARSGEEQPTLEADVLRDELVTMAERFQAAGFATGAFVSNPWLDRRFGFAQGFDTYDESFARWDAPGPLVSSAALRWLRARDADEPFFLYVHYLDAHRPYPNLPADAVRARLPELNADARPLSANAKRRISEIVRIDGIPRWHAEGVRPTRALLEQAYDRGIEAFDQALGYLLDGVAELRDLSRVLVIVTSDHGEALYERGYGNHGNGLYEAELAIPMVIAGRGVPQGAQACMTGLEDLLPTLCEGMSLDCPGALPGRSLLRERRAGTRVLVGAGVTARPRNRMARDARHKLIFEPDGSLAGTSPKKPYSLFDLEEDPEEQHDLLDDPAARETLAPVVERLRTAVAAAAGEATPSESKPLDAELQDRLEALGYLE
ncbi:MAG: sulfatase [Myxococcales bacterium]|nr:sulfatase [Myxococcales bacterium]